jgi:hypothetical protein
MFELLIRSLCDTLPVRVDGVYLFAQTQDNQESVLNKGRQLLQDGITEKLIIDQTAARSGYLGYEVWQQQLLAGGVAAANLEGLVIDDDILLHTRSEAEALINWALQQRYQDLLVVASPFQQPRAFMTAISAALLAYPALRLYSLPGDALPWLEPAVHSQGQAKALRKDLIDGEQERIEKYQAKGDLASYAQVLQYLNSRDQQ